MKERPTKGTKPELRVADALRRMHYKVERNRADLPGKPDIVLPSRRTAVFVHGCFWHQHSPLRCRENPKPSIPDDNSEFWRQKLLGNIARDRRKARALRRSGWHVKVVWECQTKRGADHLLERLRAKLAAPRRKAQ